MVLHFLLTKGSNVLPLAGVRVNDFESWLIASRTVILAMRAHSDSHMITLTIKKHCNAQFTRLTSKIQLLFYTYQI